MNPHRRYKVVVVGHEIGPLAEHFGDLDVEPVNGDTAIGGDRLDAAALAGLLREVDRLGLELCAVESSVEGG